ncbi:DUF2510 domain-containing protein [Janibacter limosus]|uniref:DUF2510 domain-containing protein n=1 Tax=Janibacter limosus TaxID=53458 RepID=A0A4P6MQP6_9MICO|nr:DUF2510 domain-containing protein [Janibacter limosus]QBF45249.1 DUF2510 domain-containing protein [Janibacter limosus]
MTEPPLGYRREIREIFLKENADFSNSREHDGLKSPLARDKSTGDMSHPVIGDQVEQDADRDRAPSEVLDWPRDHDVASWESDTPDISRLVPFALVAGVGIAVGVASARFAHRRKLQRQEEETTAPPAVIPAGWYETSPDSTRLRFWNGAAWTHEYAERAQTSWAAASGWHADPSNPVQLRWWDGSAWTHHVSPLPGASTYPADWYTDPWHGMQLRFWDGATWTQHVTTIRAIGTEADATPAVGWRRLPDEDDTRINMSTAEWRAHVEAWLTAGVIEKEMWRRLSHARISDPDHVTLEAQQRMEQLTAQDGAKELSRLLATHPQLRSLTDIEDFLGHFVSSRNVRQDGALPLSVRSDDGGIT